MAGQGLCSWERGFGDLEEEEGPPPRSVLDDRGIEQLRSFLPADHERWQATADAGARSYPSSSGPIGTETASPLRLRMRSCDFHCRRSMEIEWEEPGGVQQSWSSTQDPLCGWFEADALLPSNARNIRVRFWVQNLMTAPSPVCKVDRQNGAIWAAPKEGSNENQIEEILFRTGPQDMGGVDAVFELAGGAATHCYVWRAWNAGRDRSAALLAEATTAAEASADADDCNGFSSISALGGENLFVESWERWDDLDTRPTPEKRPEVLAAADLAAPPGFAAGDPVLYCADTTARLVAAASALQEVRRRTMKSLQELDQSLTGQWVAVNSANTMSAGLGVAAAAALFLAPPLTFGLAVSSAMVGGGAGAGDALADHVNHGDLRQQLSRDAWNTFAVAELEKEWLWSRRNAARAFRVSGAVGEASEHEDSGNADLAVYTAQIGTSVAKVIAEAVEEAALVRSIGAAAAEATAPAAARVLGVAGAVVSVGIAIHGWSTTKSLQATVRRKIEELAQASLRSQRWLSAVGQLECAICHCCVH
ncbi:unnamed protein product, partial [Polarella glacialis]